MPSMACSVAVQRQHRCCCQASLCGLTRSSTLIDRALGLNTAPILALRYVLEQAGDNPTGPIADVVGEARAELAGRESQEGELMNPAWLDWARRLQTIAQNGLTFSHDHFDIERYEQLRAIAAEIMATHSSADMRMIHDLFAEQAGYATPKIDVRGVVFRDDAILLVKERADGGWTLPGGWADVGDSPAEAVVREIAEESGYQARAVKLLALYDRNKHGHPPIPDHTYKLFFLCELTGGAPAASAETDGVDFFREHELPDLSIMRVTPAQIARLFAHHRHPDWPADFD